MNDAGLFTRRYFADMAQTKDVRHPYTVPQGMARSIWEDKYARPVSMPGIGHITYESWESRLRQVALGNFLLLPSDQMTGVQRQREFEDMIRLSVEGVMAYSGRHLQHGDSDQPNKILDLFSNCSTSPFSFLMLWKSLCGKGVTGDYSSHVRPVNWDNMPNFRLVLDGGIDDSGEVSKGAHPDFKQSMYEFQGGFESLREAQHKYPSNSEWVRWFKVEDSREGWAQIVCALETAAYHETHKNKLFIFDLSDVREAGRPIMGHQGRPASGPIPLMRCLLKVATVKGAFMSPWRQAMYVDDYLAQCVSIGGVRRNARMAVMHWKDSNIFDFIEIKRGGHLRMANNTILCDEEFWRDRVDPRTRAHRVFQAACAAGFLDNTGEPGFTNLHLMRQNRQNLDQLNAKNYLDVEASGLKLHARTYDLIEKVLTAIKNAPYCCTVNPCGEATLFVAGDDCIVGDVGLHRARTFVDAVRASELMGRSLVRVSSLMPAICQMERRRTNRVGVSAIGILEFFWNHYKLGFYDLLMAHDHFIKYHGEKPFSLRTDEGKAIGAWTAFADIAQAARDGANDEADRLGFVRPDTATLLKPGGTVAKVLCATESANLPARRYYLRYTQHPKEVISNQDGHRITIPNPKVDEYARRGYPVLDVSHKYPGYVVVGFPTVQPYVRLLDTDNATDKVVTANNVSMEDQYKWLRLLEYHWLGKTPEGEPQGAQISITMKFNPRRLSFEDYMRIVAENQPTVRCCTMNVCSSDDEVFAETKELIENYGFAPETPLSRDEYEQLIARIDQSGREDYDPTCEAGVCAIDENIN